MRLIRKEALKRLIFIALGMIPIFLIGNEKGPVRFVAAAGILFSLYNLIFLLHFSKFLFEDLFPIKPDIEKKTTLFDRIISGAISILVFLGLALQVFEIKTMDNTLQGVELFWSYGFLGILLAIVILFLLHWFSPSLFSVSKRRYWVFLGLFLGLFLVMPAAASFVNHFFSDKEVESISYKVEHKGSSSGKRKEFFIFCHINGDIQRFTVSKSLWDQIKEDQEVEFLQQKGFLDYMIIRDIRVVK